MKIDIITKNLLTKLTFINDAISAKSQLPVLLNLLLEAKEGKLTLSSTDLEIGIETTIPATIIEDGGITVPARTFTELISSLTDASITLQTANNTLEVTGKRTKSVFQTIAREDFPKLYEEKGELIAVMDDEGLRDAFSKVVFSASTDTTRPALSGVLMRREESGFLLVATDGFRLSLHHYKLSNTNTKTNVHKSFIVPARVFRELLSIKDEKREVEMYVSANNNQIIFQHGDTILVGRLIEADFPNFEKIIPSDFSLSVSFDREELYSAVKICSIFARDSANIVKFHIQKDHITISSSSPSVGENTVDVAAVLTGEENEIAFNAKYLLDLFNTLSEEKLVFDMIGPLNPGVFKINGDASFLHLVMPIRTGQ
jgi:DNA polymerase-3 subunit beta